MSQKYYSIMIAEGRDQLVERAHPSNDAASFEAAINTEEGHAFYSTLDRAFRHNEHAKGGITGGRKKLIEEYLDQKTTNSIYRHVILGHYLLDLYMFDKEWIRPRLDQLFSKDNESYTRSAWNGHLYDPSEEVCVDLNEDIFVDLAGMYEAHIMELKNPILDDYGLCKSDRQVVKHVVKAHLFGFDRAKELFDYMILHSHDKVRSCCAWAVGQWLRIQLEKSYESFDVNAVRELWKNSRLACNEELRTWVIYTPFERTETLVLLCNSVEKSTGAVDITFFPIRELESYAETHSKLTIKYLDLLIRKRGTDPRFCFIIHGIKDLFEILCKNPDAKLGIDRLIDQLERLGFRNIRS